MEREEDEEDDMPLSKLCVKLRREKRMEDEDNLPLSEMQKKQRTANRTFLITTMAEKRPPTMKKHAFCLCSPGVVDPPTEWPFSLIQVVPCRRSLRKTTT